jgi:uridine kinase
VNQPSRTSKKGAFIIGIAGASGSGKNYLAERLQAKIADKAVCVLSQDYYYKDHSDLSMELRNMLNYDHPSAVDFSLMAEHLKRLKNGLPIQHPLYDFSVHNRKKESKTAGPANIVIVDGVLIYALEDIRNLFDFKVFIDTSLDICFIRRLQRDTSERGRTVDSVISQYLKTVRPMYTQFALPTRKFADFIVVGEGTMEAAIMYILRSIPQ